MARPEIDRLKNPGGWLFRQRQLARTYAARAAQNADPQIDSGQGDTSHDDSQRPDTHCLTEGRQP